MAFLSDPELDRILGMESVIAAVLLELNFVSETNRIWAGIGPLRAGGHDWQGTGEFVSVSGLEQIIGTASPAMTITLSGIDVEMTRLVRKNDFEVTGATASVYGQLFDDRRETVGAPFHIFSGDMGKLTYQLEGPNKRTIEIPIEGIFSRRKRPRFGLFTNADQHYRHSGDRGLEYIEALSDKTVTWPDF